MLIFWTIPKYFGAIWECVENYSSAAFCVKRAPGAPGVQLLIWDFLLEPLVATQVAEYFPGLRARPHILPVSKTPVAQTTT